MKKINIIDSNSYFQKGENDKWQFISGEQNSASFLKKYKMTDKVNAALGTIFDLANPEEENEIYYDFARNRTDNKEEEMIVLDWLGW